jgi:Protein kinase domain
MRFTYTTGDQPVKGYTIQRGLGRGGFGEVYQAVSDGGKEVALKLVQRNLNVELRGVGQCLNLKHHNLVALYDVKQADNGDTWVVMEYVAGGSLDQVIARNRQGMPVEEAVFWLRGLCAGVGYLHERGIVHRDLKPGNIFIENGIVKLGDYGLSKFISASRRSGQTESVGTVHYMAPEVSMGRYNRELDLYAVGVILYEMLTGQVPFDGESPGEILMKHLTAVPDLTPLPEPFRPVVGRLLEKDPLKRYPSVEALLADLPPVASWAGAPSGYSAVPPPRSVYGPEPGPETQPYHSALLNSEFRARLNKVGAAMVSAARVMGAAARHFNRRPKIPSAWAEDGLGTTALARLFVAAVFGVGAALLASGFGLLVFGRNEEAAALCGIGIGLLTTGKIARNLLRPVLEGLWWRALVPILSGVGTGLLVGGIATGVLPRISDAPPFLGIGGGFLVAARTALRLFPSARSSAITRLFWTGSQSLGILFLAVGVVQLFRPRHEAPVLMGIGSAILVAGVMAYRALLKEPVRPKPSTDGKRETAVGVVEAEEVAPPPA